MGRRKFLKRTGGATFAASLAWVPTRGEAQENEETESAEKWNMDWAGASGTFGLAEHAQIVGLQGNTGVTQIKVISRIYFAPAPLPGQSLTDTLQIRCLAYFTLLLEDAAGVQTPLIGTSVQVDVSCNPDDGQMGQVALQLSGDAGDNGEFLPFATDDYVVDGKTFRFIIAGGIDTSVSNEAEGEGYKLKSRATALANITTIVNGQAGEGSGISISPPGEAVALQVSNTFISKKE